MYSLTKTTGVRIYAPILSVLLLITTPDLFAHNSIAEVETQIKDREPYLELTDQVAPGFAMQNVAGNEVRLTDFRGKVVILNFIYSRCSEDCPLHSLKLAKVQQQLAEASLSESIQFITIATDTEDAASTADSMRPHGQRYGLNPENWIFLYGGPGREALGRGMAQAYGLLFVPTGTGEQMHGVVTHLIDGDGQLRARYHGLKFVPVNLTVHAAALAQGGHAEKVSAGKFVTTLLKDHWVMLLSGLISLGLLAWIAFSYWRQTSLLQISTPPRKGDIQ